MLRHKDLTTMLAAFAAVAFTIAALWLLGATEGMRFGVSEAVAGCVAALCLRATGNWSSTCRAALLVAWTLLTWSALMNVWSWTVVAGYPPDDPYVAYEQDHFRFVVALCEGFDWPGRHYSMMPAMLMAAVLKVFGVNVTYIMALNTLITLMAIAVIGKTASCLLSPRTEWSGERIAALAMLMAGVSGFFIFNGVRLWKEPTLYLASALSALVLVKISNGDRLKWTTIAATTIAGAIFCWSRPSYMLVFVAATALCALGNWRKSWRTAALCLMIYGIFFGVSIFESLYGVAYYNRAANTDVGSIAAHYIVSPSQAPVEGALGQYFTFPLWKKILVLPFVMALQFVLPLPWSMEPIGNPAEYLARINYGWYVIGALVLFYFGWICWRKNAKLRIWALCALMSFAATAYASAGTVSRYMLPFFCLYIPLAVYVLADSQRLGVTRALKRGMLAFAALFAIGMCGAYYVQHRSVEEKYGKDVDVRANVRDPFKNTFVEKDSTGHFHYPSEADE